MCTCFAVYNGHSPIYGMNFDADEMELKLSILNHTDNDVFYFSAFLGDTCRDIAGMNSDGLFICTQALEYSHDFRPSGKDSKVYAFDVIEESLRKGKVTSDFLSILGNRSVYYDTNIFFPEMGLHTMIADLYGDGVILEEGKYTNVLRKIDGKFIVMTNFPVCDFINKRFDEVSGCGADRYIEAYKCINNSFNEFGVNEAFDVLKNTRQDMTLCSIVFEPLKSEAYVCFKTDFDKKWKVSIKEKTIHSLNGLNQGNLIHFTAEGVRASQLNKLYE